MVRDSAAGRQTVLGESNRAIEGAEWPGPGQEEGRVQPTQRETRYHGKDKLKGSREPERWFFKFRTLSCNLPAFTDNKAAGNLISPL